MKNNICVNSAPGLGFQQDWECDKKATRAATRIRDNKEFKLCGNCARRFKPPMFKIEKIK